MALKQIFVHKEDTLQENSAQQKTTNLKKSLCNKTN
jgi:hypothetical protein